MLLYSNCKKKNIRRIGGKMKKGIYLLLTVILFTLSIGIASGESNVPGSIEDPIVTQSYVDTKTTYKAVKMEPGQKLIGDAGTEVILRSGEATAIDNGANGISDITGGRDLMTGDKVQLNHLILIPRNDGRGFMVSTEAWIMIRGNYTLN